MLVQVVLDGFEERLRDVVAELVAIAPFDFGELLGVRDMGNSIDYTTGGTPWSGRSPGEFGRRGA
jgi:hypothetical protein